VRVPIRWRYGETYGDASSPTEYLAIRGVPTESG
jgi:hypothetical protein